MICIAASFSHHDRAAVQKLPGRIDLVRYRIFDGGLLLGLLLVDSVTGFPSAASSRRGREWATVVDSVPTDPAISSPAGGGTVPEYLRGLYAELDEALTAWGEVEVTPLRHYIAYRRLVNVCASSRRPTWRRRRRSSGGRSRQPDATGRASGASVARCTSNELGVDMPTIMEILRHTQISQTHRYVQGRSHRRTPCAAWATPSCRGRTLPRSLSRSPVRNRQLRPELRPRTAARRAQGVVVASAERKSPAQTPSELGFSGAAFGIRTRDLRITRACKIVINGDPRSCLIRFSLVRDLPDSPA